MPGELLPMPELLCRKANADLKLAIYALTDDMDDAQQYIDLLKLFRVHVESVLTLSKKV